MSSNERRLDEARQAAEAPALPGPERSTVSEDPYVLKVRREISDLDSSLVALVNKRLKLVAQLKRYKEEHGIGFVDLQREEWMLQYLQRGNGGPLSAEGLGELYHYVLDLTKQEVLKTH
jgi:chorismate mutase